MKQLVRPLLIVAALGGGAVVISLAVGRSASLGLYLSGAALIVLGAISHATFTGAYGELTTVDAIRHSNTGRAAYLFSGIALIGLGVLVETLWG